MPPSNFGVGIFTFKAVIEKAAGENWVVRVLLTLEWTVRAIDESRETIGKGGRFRGVGNILASRGAFYC